MYPINYELAKARMDDRIREAERQRLVHTAKEARRSQQRPQAEWLAVLRRRRSHAALTPATALPQAPAV